MEKVLALFDTAAEADEAVEELLSLGYDEGSIGYALKLIEQEEVLTEEETVDEVLVEDVEIGEFPGADVNEYDFSDEDPDDERHQMLTEDLYVNREIAEIEEFPREEGNSGVSTFVGAGHLGALKVAVVPDFGRLLGAGSLASVVESLSGDTVGETGLSGPEGAIWAEWSDDLDRVPEWAQPFRQGLEQGAVLLSALTPDGEGSGLASILEEAGASEVGVFPQT